MSTLDCPVMGVVADDARGPPPRLLPWQRGVPGGPPVRQRPSPPAEVPNRCFAALWCGSFPSAAAESRKLPVHECAPLRDSGADGRIERWISASLLHVNELPGSSGVTAYPVEVPRWICSCRAIVGLADWGFLLIPSICSAAVRCRSALPQCVVAVRCRSALPQCVAAVRCRSALPQCVAQCVAAVRCRSALPQRVAAVRHCVEALESAIGAFRDRTSQHANHSKAGTRRTTSRTS